MPEVNQLSRLPYCARKLGRASGKDFDVDDMERKFSGAADAVRVGLSASFAKASLAGLDVLHFGPLAAVGLGLRLVSTDGNADVVVAVRVEERGFAGREQDVE